MNRPFIGASTPLSITLEYWAWLMHMAMACAASWLLNGAAAVLSMTHCTVGWPTHLAAVVVVGLLLVAAELQQAVGRVRVHHVDLARLERVGARRVG